MSGGESRELKRLATLERKKGDEQIRWSWDEFTPDNGEPSKYVSVRKWYRTSEGDWRPTKAGATIRLNELDEVVAALQRVQRARDGQQQGRRPTHTTRRADDRQQSITTTGRQLTPEEMNEVF